MSKGKRAAQVNARLRAELAEATDARARLERRVSDAERRARLAIDRVDAIEREGHPAVLSSVAAAHAKVKRSETERDRSQAELAEEVDAWRPLMTRALRFYLAEHPDARVPRGQCRFVDVDEALRGVDRREVRRLMAQKSRRGIHSQERREMEAP